VGDEVEPAKYKVINELSTGWYFGEISALTKYSRATASIKAVNYVNCATIHKDKIGILRDVVSLSI
jgi:hypothetical protein